MQKCPNIEFNVVDINPARIDSWNSNNLEDLPVYEPGLDEIIKFCRNKNISFFSINISRKYSQNDMIFISVNTPTKKKGVGAGQALDLKWVESSARIISEYATGNTIVVEKSTLPVKTADTIKKILKNSNDNNKNGKERTFQVLSNPRIPS